MSNEPSALLRANPYLMGCLTNGHLDLAECERRAQGEQRLKERFSSIPWHARRAEKDPEYWSRLYASSVRL